MFALLLTDSYFMYSTVLHNAFSRFKNSQNHSYTVPRMATSQLPQTSRHMAPTVACVLAQWSSMITNPLKGLILDLRKQGRVRTHHS